MKKFFIVTTIIGLGILAVSCNNDDDNVIKTPSLLKYSNVSGNINVDFFTEGSTGVPTINWGEGKAGTFALDKSYKGLSINKDNGVISWTKEFLEKLANIEVTAKNSLGGTSQSINIRTKFKDQFKGKYNTDLNSTTLDKDITITMVDSVNGKMSITEEGETKELEITLRAEGGKLSIIGTEHGKDETEYILSLKPIDKLSFEGEIKFIKTVNNEEVNSIGKINLKNL